MALYASLVSHTWRCSFHTASAPEDQAQ